MKKLDTNGLRLAEYQGKLFELSAIYCKCSTNIFMRRFFYSDLLKILDRNDSSILSLDPKEGLEQIQEQFGQSFYGKEKQSGESLFWVGFLYRYISYTRNTTTRLLMRLFPYQKLFELYPIYHTQSLEWCIENPLELQDYDSSIFDPNARLKEALKKHYKESN